MKVILKEKDSFLKSMHKFYNRELNCIYLKHIDRYKIFYNGRNGKYHEALVLTSDIIIIENDSKC